MSRTDYKAKYLDLKIKYLETRDLTWRLGYEQGLKDAQFDQAQQAAMTPQQNQEGEIPTEAGQPEEEQAKSPISQNPNGDDELGQHIEKLESMLGKSEISSLELQDLKKTLNDIRSLQVQINLTKSMNSIKNSKLSKSQSFAFSPKVVANLPEQSKKALSMQEQIVADVFKKWENDSSKAAHDINSILNVEGITKKD